MFFLSGFWTIFSLGAAVYWEAPPEMGTFFSLQVYERLGESVISLCEIGPKGLMVHFMAVKKSNSHPGFVIYSYWKTVHLQQLRKGCLFCEKWYKGKGVWPQDRVFLYKALLSTLPHPHPPLLQKLYEVELAHCAQTLEWHFEITRQCPLVTA